MRTITTRRCTGAAMSVAIGLLECCHRNSAAHVILFTGGPCTFGPGRSAQRIGRRAFACESAGPHGVRCAGVLWCGCGCVGEYWWWWCGQRKRGFGILCAGLVVSPSLDESMRSHIDIEKGNAKHAAKASKFYKALAQRLVNNGHAMDCFACALDQVQLFPDAMRACRCARMHAVQCSHCSASRCGGCNRDRGEIGLFARIGHAFVLL